MALWKGSGNGKVSEEVVRDGEGRGERATGKEEGVPHPKQKCGWLRHSVIAKRQALSSSAL